MANGQRLIEAPVPSDDMEFDISTTPRLSQSSERYAGYTDIPGPKYVHRTN